jgi:Sap, sulfolipid-1-addressing protein
LVIVFALQGSGVTSTTQRTVSPLADIVLGVLLLVIALVLGTERDKPLRERRASRKEGKEPPRWQRTLGSGSARGAFIIGIALSLPGASAVAGMTRLSKLDYDTPATVGIVVAFNLVALILLEGPLIAFALAPDRTVDRIDRAKAWIAARGRHYAVRGLTFVGAALVLTGIVELLA